MSRLIGLLLRLGLGAGPAKLVAWGLVLSALGAFGWAVWQGVDAVVFEPRRTIAAQEEQLEQLNQENGRLAGEVRACAPQIEKLQQQVGQQNTLIAQLRDQRERDDSAATEAAIEELERPDAGRAASVQEYQAWLDSFFSRSR